MTFLKIFFFLNQDLCSSKWGHVTKSKIKEAMENLQDKLQNKIKTLAEEDEILFQSNVSNIVNKLINASETAQVQALLKIPIKLKSVQQIPNKQGSNIFKVTLQPKSKISFQDYNKTLSFEQKMMKNLKIFTQNLAKTPRLSLVILGCLMVTG